MSDSMVSEVAIAGRIGFVSVAGVAVVLAIHPFGTTGLYDDGERFLDHVGWYWIALHLIATVLLMTWPLVIHTWAKALATTEARFIGKLASSAALIGMGVGVIHLIATDTMTFLAFGDTFAAGNGSEATIIGADVLLRIHAATLTAFVLSLWFAVPAFAGWATIRDGRFPGWVGGGLLLIAGLQVVAILITVAEEQWTTTSEMGFFRGGATLLIFWLLATTWSMRKGELWHSVPAVGTADSTHGAGSRATA